MRRITSNAAYLTAAGLAALVATGVFAGDVPYKPKQEIVPDFGQFVPEHDVSETLPYEVVLERVTTATPWGRGMVKVDGQLIVLSRGAHRGEGGPDEALNDSAGVLWIVDPSISEPVVPGAWAGGAVRHNAAVFVRPTSPPFHLYDFKAPPEQDILMGRPYCALAYDELSRNLFVCAYSGAELSTGFRKHATDAVYRYDLRNETWHVVEQHDPDVVPREQLGAVISNEYYPHHDPATNPPPHGWPNGANGCIGVGEYLYVPAKDNHMVVQYDLESIRRDPNAPPPDSRPVLGPYMRMRTPVGEHDVELLGVCSVAHSAEYLYIGYRTSSVVVRVRLDESGDVVRNDDNGVTCELIAVFEPWDAAKKRSGNMYDIAMSDKGELFVSMGTEGKVWRITPDPNRTFYGNDRTDRPTTTPPFVDMSEKCGRKTGCNNIFVDDEQEYLYISSRSNDTGEGRIHGTIYRAKINPKKADGGAMKWDFEQATARVAPSGWRIAETNPTEQLATWQCIDDATAPSGSKVLALTTTTNYNGTYNLAIADGTSLDDLDLRVMVKAVSGDEDQGGGPIWRCIDEYNYYTCRFNPLESNFRVYVVNDSRRRQLDSAQHDLETDRWYELHVVMRGNTITCWLDGQELLNATDATLNDPGQVGLWTKADAVASFDDLQVQPLRR